MHSCLSRPWIFPTLNSERRNTTVTPEMRDLARRLLAYEAALGGVAAPAESSTLRVYDKLRQALVEFTGVAGFQSLASRALGLALADAPCLGAARVATDGSLQGLGECELPMRPDRDPVPEAAAIFIARLLCLLLIFIGEALTLCLLRPAWPAEVLDDFMSGNGRKV